MADLSELYQSVILDHNRTPRNFREMERPDRRAEGYNPLCGDKLTVWLKMDGDRIADVSFQGRGCAISTASASLMTTMVKGRTKAEAEAMATEFRRLVTGQSDSNPPAAPASSVPHRLAAFAGVREFPARVKCATLSWHALRAALEGGASEVSTEASPSP